MFKIIFTLETFLLIVMLFRCIALKIALLGYIHYIDKNQYRQPSKEETKACTDYAAKKLLKKSVKKKRLEDSLFDH